MSLTVFSREIDFSCFDTGTLVFLIQKAGMKPGMSLLKPYTLQGTVDRIKANENFEENTHGRTHARTHTHTHTYTYPPHTHSRTHASIHTHTCTHTHTHTHTHTLTQSISGRYELIRFLEVEEIGF